MIDRLTVVDRSRMPLSWWDKVPFCAASDGWDFGPDLTIVWGPNGSGKSTLILTLARLLHCDQGGVSKVTQTSVRALWKHPTFLTGADVRSDGKGARYIKPDKLVGSVGGQFDDDFFDEGFQNIGRKNVSSGQGTVLRLNDLPRAGEPGAEPFDVVDVVGSSVNDLWGAAKRETTRCLLDPRVPVGKTTLLLDEPDMHLDIPTQEKVWRGVFLRLLPAFQVIVATHSPWAVNVPGATYIETTDGYLAKCRESVARLGA